MTDIQFTKANGCSYSFDPSHIWETLQEKPACPELYLMCREVRIRRWNGARVAAQFLKDGRILYRGVAYSPNKQLLAHSELTYRIEFRCPVDSLMLAGFPPVAYITLD